MVIFILYYLLIHTSAYSDEDKVNDIIYLPSSRKRGFVEDTGMVLYTYVRTYLDPMHETLAYLYVRTVKPL